ncbi:MAG: transcriptional repressor [Paludibacteraceae bacterium]|jgi:Fe2+ or Zn2+ uptake regulation protein|nr:transcriptional repressor [Paludibacteraceae bacterium]
MNTQIYLTENGIKPSVQRIALMDYLLTHKTHPNVDEMYEALHEQIPTISRTTIYNTMKLFVKHGIASLISIEEKNARFDGDVSLHGHFLCQNCNQLYDFHVNEKLLNIEELFSSLDGYNIKDTQIYCKGICKNCK